MNEITKIVEAIKSGKNSARSEVEKAITIARANKDIFLEILEDEALKRADEIDAQITSGEDVGRLAGVPYVVENSFLTSIGNTTGLAGMLKNFKSPINATAIECLNNEGAILIGKTKPNDGSNKNNSMLTTVVAASMVPFALSKDTAGDIHQRGVIGMRPTYGMISRYGVMASTASMDVVGMLVNTVADAEILCDILAGPDDKDGVVFPDFYKIETTAPKKVKIGLIKEFIDDEIDPEIRQNTLDFAEKLRAVGHKVEEVNLSMAKYSSAIYDVIVSAEMMSSLARYDGVRYGDRSAKAKNLDEVYSLSRGEGLSLEEKRRIMVGTYLLSGESFENYYLQACRARTLLIQEFNKLFAEYDFLIGPVAPSNDITMIQASLTGNPAISFSNGVQIIGPQKSDAKLLAFAGSIKNE